MTSNGQLCSCCTPKPEPHRVPDQACPQCGTPSQHRVHAATVHALLKESERDHVGKGDYLLCSTQACPVVYFDPEIGEVFGKAQLSVRVGFKETEAPRPLCYCFDHSWESLQQEWLATGQSTALATIRAAIRSAGCRCEETNPKGVCCLGDITEALNQIQAQGAERHPR